MSETIVPYQVTADKGLLSSLRSRVLERERGALKMQSGFPTKVNELKECVFFFLHIFGFAIKADCGVGISPTKIGGTGTPVS